MNDMYTINISWTRGNAAVVAIVDYKAGNLTSMKLALEYLGVACEIARKPDVIRGAERVIFPGDGAAAAAMEHLNELGLLT